MRCSTHAYTSARDQAITGSLPRFPSKHTNITPPPLFIKLKLDDLKQASLDQATRSEELQGRVREQNGRLAAQEVKHQKLADELDKTDAAFETKMDAR